MEAQTTLVNTGAVWKYLADGSDQGTVWKDPGFNDAAWPSGAAEIGFGDGDEVTNVGTNRTIVTYYFRHVFTVANPGAISTLALGLIRDDGAVVYLNGTEVFRSNMTNDPVDFMSFAATASDDGNEMQFGLLPVSTLVNGDNVVAVEIHQAGTNSSDISFDLLLVANPPPTPPTVAITSPTNNATINGINVSIAATATDVDGTIVSVGFYADGVLVASDTTSPYNGLWTGAAGGVHTLTAVATDSQGLSTTSAPVSITVVAGPPALIPLGAIWRYLADGSDQGTSWREFGFDDSAWANGPARLGFGGDGELTVIGDAANGFITFYFRRHFTVADPGAIEALSAVYQRDDGLVVYVNGTEAFRNNMPTGDILASTLASSAGAEQDFFTNSINPNLLFPGDNVIAVEVHQNSATSSDIGFNLALYANLPSIPPTVAITSPANGATVATANLTLNATASDPDGSVATVRFFRGNSLVATDAEAPYQTIITGIAPGTYTFTAVATDNRGTMSTSAPVTVTITTPPESLIAFGSAWRYLDDGGLTLDPAWNTPFIDDSGWALGTAELGFGDNDETTVIQRVNSLGETNIAFYFRRVFNVGDTAGMSNLVLRLVRDDGAVVYINGLEVFRNNLPEGDLTPQSLAVDTVEDEPIVAATIDLLALPDLLFPGENLIAVAVHQQGVGSSDVSFDLELRANVTPVAPAVTITSPTNGAGFLSTEDVVINATATDLDGNVVQVEFFVDGVLVGTPDQTFAYSRTAAGLSPGTRVLTAVATDDSGRSTTSAPVSIIVTPGPIITTMVATGSVWKYLDTGADQGTAWRAPAFDDSGWPAGPGELGFGDGNEATVISSNSPNVLYYFRQAFEVANAAAYTNLAFRVRRDDGCVAYLNGTEIFRMNMPAGTITASTFASAGTSSETTYFPTNVNPAGLLVNGRNVLAVQVHQNTRTSSDISFDLELIGFGRQTSAGPEVFIARDGADVLIRWFPAGGQLLGAPTPVGPFSPVSTDNPHRVVGAVGANTNRFFRVQQ